MLKPILVTYLCTCHNGLLECGGSYKVTVSDDFIEPERCIWCGEAVEVEIIHEEEI